MNDAHAKAALSPFVPDCVYNSNIPLNPPSLEVKSARLSGMRLAVKDVFHIAGIPTSAGNPAWLATHDIPQVTHSTVVKLLEHGATFVGKTITDELAYSLNGQNIHYGTPVNVRSPERLPGGSSSGSAVAVASALADIGLGTDTGGSIRVPASYNGLYGLRPTHGKLSLDNMVPLAKSFDTVGWFTRTIEQMETVASCLFGGELQRKLDEQEKDVKIASLSVFNEYASQTAQIRSFIEKVNLNQVRLNQSSSNVDVLYHFIESDGLSKLVPQLSEAFRVLQASQIWQQHGTWIEQHTPTFAADIDARFRAAKDISQNQINEAITVQTQLKEELSQLFEHYDFLLLPTTPGVSPLLATPADELSDYRTQLLTMTAIAGLAGLPQLHLPLFEQNNAPCGLSLLGPRTQAYCVEHALICSAKALESIYYAN